MNKNIKKLVLTTAGLTLGMVAVGNMSAETNVAMAWETGMTYPEGTALWNPQVEGDYIHNVSENGRTFSGNFWLANAKVKVKYDKEVQKGDYPDYEEHILGTTQTDANGYFTATASEDIPAGEIIWVNVYSPEGTINYGKSGGYHLQKGLISTGGGSVTPTPTPEPEKPTPTPDFSTNTWEQNGSDWYCYDSNGTMITGWMQDGNNWYYFNQDGSMHKGWLESNGLWYSFRDNGQMKRGWEKINGTQYFFTDSGRLAYDEWLPYGSDWFYVNKKGRMLQNEWQPYNGSWFYFDAKGAMVTNQYVGGSYVDASGRAI